MISIIVPVYNVENYLGECLNSICNQTFTDFEIICVNDGSTDDSLKILKNYAKFDSRIKIIYQRNHGPGKARNTGLKYASGEYIIFVDADDFIEKDMLSELYFNAVSNDSDLLLFKFNSFNETDNSYLKLGLPFDDLFNGVDFNNFLFSYNDIKMHVMNSYFSVWAKLYKKDFLDNYSINFQENNVYEDVLFQIKCFLFANKISFVPKYLYNYRISNNNSIMHDKSKIFHIFDVVNSVEDFLNDFSYMDEFKKEFLIFKIVQFSQYIELGQDEYFCLVKREMDALSKNEVDKLPVSIKTIFYNIINSSDLSQYLHLL